MPLPLLELAVELTKLPGDLGVGLLLTARDHKPVATNIGCLSPIEARHGEREIARVKAMVRLGLQLTHQHHRKLDTMAPQQVRRLTPNPLIIPSTGSKPACSGPPSELNIAFPSGMSVTFT